MQRLNYEAIDFRGGCSTRTKLRRGQTFVRQESNGYSDPYILSYYDGAAVLVNMNEGTIWRDPAPVQDSAYLSQEEASAIFGDKFYKWFLWEHPRFVVDRGE